MPATTISLACPSCGVRNRVLDARLLEAPVCGRCRAPLMPRAPVPLTEEVFADFVTGTELPVVVDFWAQWCGPCKAMAPAFAQAAEMRPRTRFAKLDTDRAGTVAAQYGIRSIPTMIAFRGGKEIARISGAMGAQQIVTWIDRSFQS